MVSETSDRSCRQIPTAKKRAVSIELRNRWRRLQMTGNLREEKVCAHKKHIACMIVSFYFSFIDRPAYGKNEDSRGTGWPKLATGGGRLSRFEATQIHRRSAMCAATSSRLSRDLGRDRDLAARETQAQGTCSGPRAHYAAEERRAHALGRTRLPAPPTRTPSERAGARRAQTTRKSKIEGPNRRAAGMPMFEIPGMPGAQVGARFRSAIIRQRWVGGTRRGAA